MMKLNLSLKLFVAAIFLLALLSFASRPMEAQTFTSKTLHSFTGDGDGAYPYAGLIMDSSGNLYGTTENGGSGYGTVFELAYSGGSYSEKILYTFTGTGGDGANPWAGLIMDSSGNLYGTTPSGGSGYGTVFELAYSRGSYSEEILYSFTDSGGDGANPYAGLIMDSTGNLYGTTALGGAYGVGTVFQLAYSAGSYNEKVLHSFTKYDGLQPYAGVIMDSSGNLYGTVYASIGGYGTVFELAYSAGSYSEKILYTFTGTADDGANPSAGLIMDSSGNLYGTTYNGGSGYGTVFELAFSGGSYSEKILYSFTGTGGDGANPWAGLITDSSGNLYGTTPSGGSGYGTVFELAYSGGSYSERVLHGFTDSLGDGASPYAGLITDSSGNIFGATTHGGGTNDGTVFELTRPPCTVADNSDDPQDTGSLRYCVNNATSGEIINFSSALNGQTITLSPDNGPLTINSNLTIQGPGANLLTISGGNAVQVFNISSGTVNISAVTVVNGNGVDGGGISNAGTLTLSNSTISGNTASSDAGGIFNAGTLTVSNSTLSGNTAVYGGGIFNGQNVQNLALAANDATVSGNTATGGSGGGIFNMGGTLTLTNTIVAGNSESNAGDDCVSCGTQSGYNLISTPTDIVNSMLASLGNYGGSTQTMLPLPGSAVICAGSASLIPSGTTTDQRGFPNRNTSYAGFSASSPCVDLGAAQTDYQSVQFTNADSAYSGLVNQPISPAPVISITENGQNIGGVPLTLGFSGTGTATGLGPVTTVAGTGATFSSLSVDTAGSDTLSATLPIEGSFSLSASAALNIAATTVQVTVGTSPAGLSFSVDGTPYTSAQTLTWIIGTTHTIATTSPQILVAGTENNFVNWSDGTTSLSDSVTASASTTSYTATFTNAYLLTTAASPTSDGTVSPSSGNYYASGTVVNLSAVANTGYAFTSWTGNVNSPANNPSTTITMIAPESVTANFQAISTCTVTDTSDNPSDTGSLRYCIGNVASGGTITFASSLNGQTITLNPASGPLAINTNLSIEGPGANLLTISGGGAVGVFSIGPTTVTVSGLTIANGNSVNGGGIQNNGGTVTVSGCTFAGNAAQNGGGIDSSSGTLTVSNSTFSGNTTNGGSAGAIYNNYGTLTLSNSTLSGNSARYGGGIFNFGTLIVNNSTISGNTIPANGAGAGIINAGSGVLVEAPAGPVTLTNSIVAGNTPGTPGDDCDGCGTQSAYNLIGGNPQLAPLAWYGGPTQTIIPLPGSPAINAGQVTASDDPATDQRGFYRPSMTGATITLGAAQPTYMLVTTSADQVDANAACDSNGDSPCSLRDAIALANTGNNTQGTDIAFASGVTGTINLSTVNTALAAITGNLDLIGPGASSLTVSGGNSQNVGNIFTLNSGANAAFSGITIANGVTSGYYSSGGGISNAGTLTVSNGTISGNIAVGYGNGGGISNTGTMTLVDSTVSGNSVNSSAAGGDGGGIINGGTLIVIDSTVAGNFAFYIGGGILNNGGTLAMIDSTVSSNTSGPAGGNGGGILNNAGGTVTLANTIVAGNNSDSDPGDDCDNCGTQSSSNLINTPINIINPDLAPLALNGGPTQTMLPLPGSPAICAGSAAQEVGVITDQRGFGRLNTTYSGYTASSPCADTGAVQTNYQSLQFTSASYAGTWEQAVSPAPVVSVTENGQNIGGLPLTLMFAGTGTATGLGPITTVGGTGATFSALVVNVPGNDMVSIALPVVGSYSLNASAGLTVNSATPTITWATPSPITYGTALSAVQLDATASVPGTFAYSPAAGTVLGGGNQALSVTFTPMNSTDYTTATANVTLVVNKATPTVTFTGAPTTAGYNSSFIVSATTNASSVAVITASGACSVAGSSGTTSTIVMTSGTGTCSLVANWAADNNYFAASGSQSTTATKIAPAIAFTGAPATAGYSSKFAVSATTNASTAAIITASGSCSIAGTTVTISAPSGTCLLSASWATDNNYLAASATQSTIATMATPTINWTTPAAITYGTALSGTQLDATATYNGATVAGTFVYTPPKGTVPTAGTQTLSVTFTPTKTADFTSAGASVALQVNPATPKITWTKPSAITYGTALGSAQLDATASVQGTFAYSPATGTILTAGTQTLSVSFTPTDSVDYTTATDSVTLTVQQATPTVTWATPAAMSYGTALSSTQLDATASVPGTFVYSPTAGAVQPGGTDKLSVTFTPSDSTDYSTVKASVTLVVNPATPTINWPTPAAITYGTALNGTQLDATATSNGSAVAGAYVYTPAKGTVLTVGTQTLSVTFTPNNTGNYSGATASVVLQVNQATPAIAWSKPAAITYGTALSSTQLDATASVSGTFVYSPTAGTMIPGGTDVLSVTFTPTDTVDYTTASDSVSITVNQATSTTSITSDSPNPSVIGQAVSIGFTVTGVGTPTGTVTVTAGTGETCTGSLTGGTGSCMLTFTAAGSPKLTAAYGGDTNFKASTSAKVTQTVNP